MKRLTLYIIKEISFPLLFGVMAFTFIIFGTSIMFSVINEAIKYHIPLGQTILLLTLQLPQVINLSLPMGTLLGSLVTFSRLNNDHEIIAIRASGISLSALIKPVLICGLTVSFVGIILSEFIVPNAMTTANNLSNIYKNQNKPTIKKNITFTEYNKGMPKRIINIKEVKKGELKNVTIAEFNNGELNTIIKAKKGEWLTSNGWKFHHGIMHKINPQNPLRISTIKFKKEIINLEMNPSSMQQRNRQVIELNARELKERIKEKKKLGLDTIRDLMDYHTKFAIAFASLIFALLGIPIGFKPQRNSSATGIGLTLITILIYYVLISIGMALGRMEILNPILATWLPNIIIGTTSIIMLKRIIKH
ncbi:MAG: LptF/LptG family permease [bacterium]